jgi:spore coat polysaccharide biosynthesis protein SpsF
MNTKKSKLGIIIQARMGSSRLPGKTLMDLVEKPMLWHIVNRCRKSKYADTVVIATTTDKSDNAIERFCIKNKIPCHRGSVDNVLNRYYETARKYKLSVIARITADCPLIDPVTIDRIFQAQANQKCDYISNVVPGERTFPRGLDAEVFSFSSLERAHKKAKDKMETEHVTPYIWQNKNKDYQIGKIVTAPNNLTRDYRLTVDYPEDFALIDMIYEKFSNYKTIPINKVIDFLDKHPEIANINKDCEQKHTIHAPVNAVQRKTK